MAGGPLHPVSIVPLDPGGSWIGVFVGDGTTTSETEAAFVGINTDFSADTEIFNLVFQMPGAIPTGTGKLRIMSMCDATSGRVSFIIKSASVNVGEDPSSASMTTEGTNQGYTWSTNDDDEWQETMVTLTAGNLVADEMLHILVIADDGTFTMAQDSAHVFSVIWE